MANWRTIPGYPMYLVSDEGEVKSKHSGKILTKYKSPDGYYFINAPGRDGRNKRLQMHVLVAAAFLGPRPPEHIVHHKNAVRTYNWHINLEYKHDTDHRSDHAGERVGERNPNAKLSNEEAQRLYTLYHRDGIKQRELAKLYGVSQSVVSRIVRGKGYAQ